MKIKKKLFLAVFIPTITLTIFGMGVIYYFSYASLKDKICDHLCSTAKSKAQWVSSYFLEKKRDIDVLSNMPAIIDNLTELEDAQAASGMDTHSFLNFVEYSMLMKQMDAYLKNFKEQHGYYDIFIIDHNGNILYTVMHEADFSTNILNGPYKDTSLGKAVRSAIETKEVASADYEYYPPSDEPAAFLANIIHDDEGFFHGVIAAQLPIHKINEIMQDRTGLGETGETYLVGRDYLMRSDSRFFEESTILKQKVDTENARTCFANITPDKEGGKHHEGPSVFNDYRGVRVIGCSFYIPELDWALLAEIDEAEGFASLRLLLLVFALVGVTITFFSFIVARKLGRTISKPIWDLHRGTEIIGNGNLDYKVGTATQDEVGQLSRAFDTMVENLKGVTASRDGLNKEITERKQAEEALKGSEKRYQNLIEFANVGIIITDDGKITQINRIAERIYNYSKGELIGQPASILTLKEYSEKHREMLDGMRKTGVVEKAIFEEEGVRKGGTLFPIEISFSLANPKGNTVIAVMRDISERKKMENELLQSEKLRSLGELAGGVAHNFNNLLAVILGNAQLLKMVVEPPPGEEERRKSVLELKRGLEIIEDASRDGAEVVRRINQFSLARDEMVHATVNLNEIIDHTLEFTKTRWKDEAESKGIAFNIQRDFSSLPPIGDRSSELREVFTNIINNACDAMPQGGEIRIKTFKEDSYVVVKIEDTGVGIPRAIRHRIFDPFFTTKGVKSTGLGMSDSYGIINRHRGTISVDSIEGQGTTFTIKLPISESVVEAEKIKPIEVEHRKAKILVIEDEEQVLNLLSDILVKGGHEVETATNGNQGIEIFEKNEFDLVFTDLGMPGLSGWQVAEKIKSIDGRMPVVLITGWNVDLKESEMRDKWIDLIVKKPFEVEQVLNLVQEGMMLRERFKAV